VSRPETAAGWGGRVRAVAGDPLHRHRSDAPKVLAEGDPAAIKRLYIDLGDGVWEEHRGDPEAVPLFSLAGTHPVVAGALADVRGTVLDAGCGPNPALSIALARAADRVTVSLDIGHGTVRSAVTAAAGRGVTLRGVVGDVEALPFRDGAFDGVACDDTIEHLPDDARGAAELARVARSGAPVVIATPNRRSLTILRDKARDTLRRRRRPASDYFVSNSHLREYTWRELETLISPVLRRRHRRGVPFEANRARASVARVVNWAVQRPPLRAVSPMLVVVAEPER
jgi:SAM-dependent methyltransferase